MPSDPNTMEAGRELNIAVAEALGAVEAHAPCGDGMTRTVVFHAASMAEAEQKIREAYAAKVAQGMRLWPVEYVGPNYSGDLRAIAELCMAMRDRAPIERQVLRLVVYPYNRTYATFSADESEDDWSEGNGEHATEVAICKAALKVLTPEARDA